MKITALIILGILLSGCQGKNVRCLEWGVKIDDITKCTARNAEGKCFSTRTIGRREVKKCKREVCKKGYHRNEKNRCVKQAKS